MKYKRHEETRISESFLLQRHQYTASLSKTLLKTRSSAFGMFKGMSWLFKLRNKGRNSWWKKWRLLRMPAAGWSTIWLFNHSTFPIIQDVKLSHSWLPVRFGWEIFGLITMTSTCLWLFKSEMRAWWTSVSLWICFTTLCKKALPSQFPSVL